MATLNWSVILKLMTAFPKGFINHNGEFIAIKYGGYFILSTCESELDVKCKVLEYCSRGAFKSEPYKTKKLNDKLHTYMLNGINTFLGTSFSADDMCIIYTYLGNGIKHSDTVKYIDEYNYNMSFFDKYVD